MNVLLDTHAWLWFALENSKLGADALSQMQDPKITKWLSPASYWELAIKISTGKYVLSASLSEFMMRSIFENGFHILPIFPLHAERCSTLPWPKNGHRDPFDRLIVAQALIEDWPLLSNDLKLDSYPITRIW